jgi:N6-adenosine-specific RNA methylase IME4
MMTNALAKLDKATQMLAEAKSLDEVKNIMDIAEAARTYARAAKLGLEAQNHAAEICITAKRKAGGFLSKLDRSTPQTAKINSMRGIDSEYSEAIKEAGISPQDADRWQQISDVPEETFKKYIETTKEDWREITQAGALRIAREDRKDSNPPPMPKDKYRIIYADPPWKYGNTMTDNMGAQSDHYNLLTVEEISALPIKEMVQDNAVLFLWVTSPILEESFQVVNAWGFKYKSSFIWDKVKHVMGHYNSVRHEILLICTRGSCQPDVHKLFDSVYSEDRTEHSKKPEFFRQVIDTIYTEGKRIELFARSKADGWDVWGNDENVS